MTGTAVDVIRVAKAEVGYHEGRSGGSWNNDQKYSDEVSGLEWSDRMAWCQTFQAWVAMRAGTADIEPRTASCWTACQWFKQRGRFSEYPAVGAQVFFGPGGGSHVGRVYAYDATYAYTIEGNTNDNGSAEGNGVYLRKRLRRDSYVHGYGYPDFPGGIVSADPAWADRAPDTPTEDDEMTPEQERKLDLLLERTHHNGVLSLGYDGPDGQGPDAWGRLVAASDPTTVLGYRNPQEDAESVKETGKRAPDVYGLIKGNNYLAHLIRQDVAVVAERVGAPAPVQVDAAAVAAALVADGGFTARLAEAVADVVAARLEA